MTFALGLNIMLYKADLKLSIIMLNGILSPATVLGIERANIGLLIFSLTSVSVFTRWASTYIQLNGSFCIWFESIPHIPTGYAHQIRA